MKITVPFYNRELLLIEHKGQPYVAMKPIVRGIGLDWKSQHAKLLNRFNSTMAIITTVGKDGKPREMLCLPLRKLPAWLYSINLKKVSPAIREPLQRYQEECDEVLWQYWTTGEAITKNIHTEIEAVRNKETISQQKGSEAGRALRLRRLEKENHALRMANLKRQLSFVWEGSNENY